MGISDRHHFGWIREALAQFDAETGTLSALHDRRAEPVLWAFGAQGLDPVLEWIADTIGAPPTRVALFDKFPSDQGRARRLDINALEGLPDDACDVVTLIRASYFIDDPAAFLANLRRILRPGGLAVIDWLHGMSNAPVLDLRGDPRHGDSSTPYRTTYIDQQMVRTFAAEFHALIRHVNRPPWRANVDSPGIPLRLATRVRRLLEGGLRRDLTLETYIATCRADLTRAGKHLIEPALMEQYFKVAFRHAHYFYRDVRKFNLYLLTVLVPVGR